MKILGIDEAGRGPVIGPLVMCGYLVEDDKAEQLRSLGVKDSKMLTPKMRESIFDKIKRLADDYAIIKINANKIDELRTVTNLNKIEIFAMRQMIETLKPDKAIIDAPEANTGRFAIKVRHKLLHKSELICENFADKNYPEVGAASIIAKVTRDREIDKMHGKYCNFGSGYTSDERTIAFLKNWIKMNKEFPDIVRKSWMTAETLKKAKEQKTIFNFMNNVKGD